MGLYVSVQNGTRAGWKTQRERRVPWTCSQGHENPGYMVRCRECREEG